MCLIMFKRRRGNGINLYKYLLIIIFVCLIPTKGNSQMRALLVDNLYSIVTSSTKTQEALTFIQQQGFSELTLYTGGPISTRVLPSKEVQLNNFITQARLKGITKINIAIGSNIEMDNVMKFINEYNGKVDGFWLEYEWWNNKPRDFNNAISLIKYIKQKGGDRTIGVYIGWIYQSEMSSLVNLVDYIYIHSYVSSGWQTYSRIKSRLDMIQMALPLRKVKVYPIFSAEWLPQEICNQGTSNSSFYDCSCFMGPWLTKNDGVKGAEVAFNTSEYADRKKYNTWRNYASIEGFYYFSFTNLIKEIK